MLRGDRATFHDGIDLDVSIRCRSLEHQLMGASKESDVNALHAFMTCFVMTYDGLPRPYTTFDSTVDLRTTKPYKETLYPAKTNDPTSKRGC
jgi:hypothetical protein